jgi:hypothetical protein
VKKQLQREAHNRNDKVKKPDYREEIALDGDDFDRGGIERRKPSQIVTLKGYTIHINTSHPDYKSDAQEYLEHLLRRECVFKIRGYESKIGWSIGKFRQHNNLEDKKIDGLYREIRDELESIYKFTINNLRRAEPFKVNSQGGTKICYKFKSGFVPVKIGKLEIKKLILDIDFFNAKNQS